METVMKPFVGWKVLLKRLFPTSLNGLNFRWSNEKESRGRTMYQLKVGPFMEHLTFLGF